MVAKWLNSLNIK